jgi:hypothetical protein
MVTSQQLPMVELLRPAVAVVVNRLLDDQTQVSRSFASFLLLLFLFLLISAFTYELSTVLRVDQSVAVLYPDS